MTMLGLDYPVTEYYKQYIIDGETLARRGGWWTAVLLITDPKTKRPFIGLYRWQMVSSQWKARKRFSFKTVKELRSALQTMERFSARLEE